MRARNDKSPSAREARTATCSPTLTESVVAIGELEIAPATALDPQRHEDVLHRDELVAELHAIRRQGRGLLAGERHASSVVDQDALVATMFVVPDRVRSMRMAAHAEVGRQIAVHVADRRSDAAAVAGLGPV